MKRLEATLLLPPASSTSTTQAKLSYIIQQSRMLESATRRYLAAIKELARVRKLQG